MFASKKLNKNVAFVFFSSPALRTCMMYIFVDPENTAKSPLVSLIRASYHVGTLKITL